MNKPQKLQKLPLKPAIKQPDNKKRRYEHGKIKADLKKSLSSSVSESIIRNIHMRNIILTNKYLQKSLHFLPPVLFAFQLKQAILHFIIPQQNHKITRFANTKPEVIYLSKASIYCIVNNINEKHDSKEIKRELDSIPGVMSVSINDSEDSKDFFVSIEIAYF